MNKSGISEFGFHMGNTIAGIASEYPTLQDVIKEQVQNALDAEAGEITIVVNLKTRRVAVRDNGNGCSQSKFDAALLQINQSSKLRSKNKLGRFGKGLISPFGKGKYFTFTSCQKSRNHEYIEWTFNTKAIEQQAESRNIPWRARPDLIRGMDGIPPKGCEFRWWSTEVFIEEITQDRVLGRVSGESLVLDLLKTFGLAMRLYDTSIQIKVTGEDGKVYDRTFKADEPTGQPLPIVQIADADAGMVTFRLGVARKTEKGRHGKVMVGETDDLYRFPFSNLRLLTHEWMPTEAAQALQSGFFEGEITATGVALHSSRKSFKPGNAVVGFCAAIEDWFDKHGQAKYNDLQEERRDEEFADSAHRCFNVLRGMLKQPQFKHLSAVLDAAKLGTIGPGHSRKGKDIVGQQPVGAIAHGQVKHSPSGGTSRDRVEPRQDHPQHQPFSVISPSGRKRSIVRDDSLGLQIVQVELDQETFWEYEADCGLLKINFIHNAWRQVEKDAKLRDRIMLFAAVQALALHSMPDEYQATQRLVLGAMVDPFAFTLINGEVLSGRRKERTSKAPLKKVIKRKA